jgi:hypothetical protein
MRVQLDESPGPQTRAEDVPGQPFSGERQQSVVHLPDGHADMLLSRTQSW